MKKIEVLERIRSTKVVPLFYNSDAEIAIELIDACHAGGARVIEFTNRGSEALDVFKKLSDYAKANYPNLSLGVGSIANVEQASKFYQNGADFLVSPFIKKEIADFALNEDILWSGGCGTLTEMQTAYEWGVPLLKLFPGNIYGPPMIKASKAPCPWLEIMPTGGVKPEEENLRSWFSAGAACVGMGSQLFKKNEDGTFDYRTIRDYLKFSISIGLEYK